MKKILLSLAIILVANSSSAQRRADVSIKLNFPANATYVRTGVPFTINFTIKNNGPDAIKPTDTLAFSPAIGNAFPVSFVIVPHANTLNAGDSIIYSLPNQTITGGNGGTVTYCSYVLLIQRALPDSVRDNVINAVNNNRSCANVNYSGVGIGELTIGTAENFVSKSYPNPASDKMNIEFVADQNEAVIIEIYDLQGRIVRSISQNAELSGTQIIEFDVTELNKGIYFYKVIKGNSVSGNKFSVE